MSVSFFDQFSNGDGTYNGAKMLAQLSGLSESEVKWTADRLKHLMHVEKMTRDAAMSAVRAEAKSKPWEQAT